MNTRPTHYMPTDPLFPLQWHLLNTGNINGSIAGYDINVVRVWPDYTGKGVVLGVMDSGFDETHPDLAENYIQALAWDPLYGQGTATFRSDDEEHGTNVAGLAVASNNGVGGVGVAFNANVVGLRFSDSPDSISTTYARFMEKVLDYGLDITVNSWGPMEHPFDYQDEQSALRATQALLTTQGRDGLGIVTLFSSGNDRLLNMNTNYDPTSNLTGAIIVAASDQAGNITGYSTPGASVLISAPGSHPASMITTDLQGEAGHNKNPGEAGNYTDIPGEGFNGTSAAAPVAAGVVALVLHANPGLGYRDVQEILAYSAARFDLIGRVDNLPSFRAETEKDMGQELPDAMKALQAAEGDLLGHSFNSATDWNGGGLMMSDHYGFGRIDALAAIRLAETWTKTSTAQNLTTIGASTQQNAVRVEAQSTVELGSFFADNARIEQMVVAIDLEVGKLLGTELELISPDGTVSRLIDRPLPLTTQLQPIEEPVTKLQTELSSVRHWGENLAGEWILRLTNHSTTEALTLNNWRLEALTALPDTTQIFTNEFGAFAQLQPERTTIKAENGVDLNASAVTAASLLNLSTGQATLNDMPVTLDSPALFRNLTTGDGNDTLVGNGNDNILMPGRGDNSVDGGLGIDVLRLIGVRENYTVVRDTTQSLMAGNQSAGSTLTTNNAHSTVKVADNVLSGGGTDTATQVELLLFRDQVELAHLPGPLGPHAFDEIWYLNDNPDVALAIQQGNLASGWQHYRTWGATEGRNPNVLFNETWYLACNADVAQAVAQGALCSGYQHYLHHGWTENRDPSAWLDNSQYLQNHTDVAAAGVNPLEHYLHYGVHEGRLLTATAFELWS